MFTLRGRMTSISGRTTRSDIRNEFSSTRYPPPPTREPVQTRIDFAVKFDVRKSARFWLNLQVLFK